MLKSKDVGEIAADVYPELSMLGALVGRYGSMSGSNIINFIWTKIRHLKNSDNGKNVFELILNVVKRIFSGNTSYLAFGV